jgi:hypothetical protein
VQLRLQQPTFSVIYCYLQQPAFTSTLSAPALIETGAASILQLHLFQVSGTIAIKIQNGEDVSE